MRLLGVLAIAFLTFSAPAVLAQGPAGNPAGAMEAARSEASKPEDTRTFMRPGGGSMRRIQIQGGGISMPQGPGGKEPAASTCVVLNREGRECLDKESDPVARRIDQGFERDPGATAPLEVKVRGDAVAVPDCFGESRDSTACN